MPMIGTLTESLRDPRLAWAAILEAAQLEQPEELTDIAISLYGQLGEAQAEICRLRASLHASVRARAPSRIKVASPSRTPS